MIEGIFYGLGCCVVAGVAFIIGRTTASRPPSEHQHIWDVWQQCELRDYDYFRGERKTVLVKGQLRDCLSCGEREVRQVSA